MYPAQPSLALGFHGCDRAVAENVLGGGGRLSRTADSSDWLGTGLYFWEGNPERALEYAEHMCAAPGRTHTVVDEPAVVGAVIDLGFCLDLLDSRSLHLVSESFVTLRDAFFKVGLALPRNEPIDADGELVYRPLDRAVMEALHQAREDAREKPFDTVRAIFPEGRAIYAGAGFSSTSHVQIVVRNPNCIKGFFRVRRRNARYPLP